ncbi:MAG: hypothetical protein QOD84_2085 [Acidobacteriaceae bacterium]|jgi:hypothetical protein
MIKQDRLLGKKIEIKLVHEAKIFKGIVREFHVDGLWVEDTEQILIGTTNMKKPQLFIPAHSVSYLIADVEYP